MEARFAVVMVSDEETDGELERIAWIGDKADPTFEIAVPLDRAQWICQALNAHHHWFWVERHMEGFKSYRPAATAPKGKPPKMAGPTFKLATDKGKRVDDNDSETEGGGPGKA